MTLLTGVPLARSMCGTGSQWPEFLGHVTPDDIAARCGAFDKHPGMAANYLRPHDKSRIREMHASDEFQIESSRKISSKSTLSDTAPAGVRARGYESILRRVAALVTV